MLLFRGKESSARSLVKAVSWRTLGSIDTFILSYIFTKDVKAAGAIASTEVITKIALYFVHERVWAQIGWGLPRPTSTPVGGEAAIPSAPGATPDGHR